eukprot:1815387-Pleurochrysis_carterae.AAC.2
MAALRSFAAKKLLAAEPMEGEIEAPAERDYRQHVQLRHDHAGRPLWICPDGEHQTTANDDRQCLKCLIDTSDAILNRPAFSEVHS